METLPWNSICKLFSSVFYDLSWKFRSSIGWPASMVERDTGTMKDLFEPLIGHSENGTSARSKSAYHWERLAWGTTFFMFHCQASLRVDSEWPQWFRSFGLLLVNFAGQWWRCSFTWNSFKKWFSEKFKCWPIIGLEKWAFFENLSGHFERTHLFGNDFLLSSCMMRP